MVKFGKKHDTTDNDIAKLSDVSEADSMRKPSWVNLTPLEAVASDSILDKLVFKPALRFHGLTGGLWGQSGVPSVATDSRPPSYRVSVSGTATKYNEPCSTCDPDSVYGSANVSAVSPLTLRRRNTIAVILIAIALLATIAAITGIVLYFMQPKEMLRANVYFTIANRNFTEDMNNRTSSDFEAIAKPLCSEMDRYFLKSELAEFYLQCRVVALRQNDTKPGLAAHFTLDFDENKVTNDGERIRNIILKKSGRLESGDTLYLVIKQFLVYLKSLRVELEVQPKPDIPYRPRIPWREDVDFIARKSEDSEPVLTSLPTNQLFTREVNFTHMPKTILAEADTRVQNVLYPSAYNPTAIGVKSVDIVLETALPVLNILVTGQPVLHHMAKLTDHGENSLTIMPSKASHFREITHFTKPVSRDIQNEFIIEKSQRIDDLDISISANIDEPKVTASNFETENLLAGRREFWQTPNKLSLDQDRYDKHLKHNHVLESSFSSYSSKSNNNQQTNSLPDNKKHEKVLTIFTDVFVILGKDAQTDAAVIRATANDVELKLVISSAYVDLQAEEITVRDPVQNRKVNMPQLSFNNVAHNLVRQKEASDIISTPASQYTERSATVSPTEIVLPILKESGNVVVEIKKSKAEPGKKLPSKPRVIVIHTNRTQNILMENFRPDITSTDRIKLVSSRHRDKQFQEALTDEIPTLFEMQEINFPPVRTNQMSEIHWFNVLNVPVGNLGSNTQDEFSDSLQRDSLINETPKRLTPVLPGNTIDNGIVNDANLIDILIQNRGNPFTTHTPVTGTGKAFLPTPIPIRQQVQDNSFPADNSIRNEEPSNNVVGYINSSEKRKSNHLNIQDGGLVPQNVMSNTISKNQYPFNMFRVHKGHRKIIPRLDFNLPNENVVSRGEKKVGGNIIVKDITGKERNPPGQMMYPSNSFIGKGPQIVNTIKVTLPVSKSDPANNANKFKPDDLIQQDITRISSVIDRTFPVADKFLIQENKSTKQHTLPGQSLDKRSHFQDKNTHAIADNQTNDVPVLSQQTILAHSNRNIVKQQIETLDKNIYNSGIQNRDTLLDTQILKPDTQDTNLVVNLGKQSHETGNIEQHISGIAADKTLTFPSIQHTKHEHYAENNQHADTSLDPKLNRPNLSPNFRAGIFGQQNYGTAYVRGANIGIPISVPVPTRQDQKFDTVVFGQENIGLGNNNNQQSDIPLEVKQNFGIHIFAPKIYGRFDSINQNNQVSLATQNTLPVILVSNLNSRSVHNDRPLSREPRFNTISSDQEKHQMFNTDNSQSGSSLGTHMNHPVRLNPYSDTGKFQKQQQQTVYNSNNLIRGIPLPAQSSLYSGQHQNFSKGISTLQGRDIVNIEVPNSDISLVANKHFALGRKPNSDTGSFGPQIQRTQENSLINNKINGVPVDAQKLFSVSQDKKFGNIHLGQQNVEQYKTNNVVLQADKWNRMNTVPTKNIGYQEYIPTFARNIWHDEISSSNLRTHLRESSSGKSKNDFNSLTNMPTRLNSNQPSIGPLVTNIERDSTYILQPGREYRQPVSFPMHKKVASKRKIRVQVSRNLLHKQLYERNKHPKSFQTFDWKLQLSQMMINLKKSHNYYRPSVASSYMFNAMKQTLPTGVRKTVAYNRLPVTSQVKISYNQAPVFGREMKLSPNLFYGRTLYNRFRTRNYQHRLQQNTIDSRSLPGYPNFTDITEMKKVLQQLVESLFDMTSKINRMQNAIDYINNTFHERNESLKSVADTIAAMTDSLNNFNSNLNDINSTLKGFKDFMRSLNNSVFNMNDVIKYLDDSIRNLDDTVYYLEESVQDMNGTLLIITMRAEDIDTSLQMINRTVIDVRDTTISTNITLDSMNKTLIKLNDIIFNFGRKLDTVLDDMDGINVSLRNISDTVRNSYARLGKIGEKIMIMNDTIDNINSTMYRLNDSYKRIDDALRQMNESFGFLNGTILDDLLDLSVLNGTLGNISFNVQLMDKNKEIMNRSLSDALEWMKAMMEVVSELNVSVERQNNTIVIGLEDKELLDTLNTLLSLNGSLSSTSKDVDEINENLSLMENKMSVLEQSLKQIEESLANMNATLSFLSKLLNRINQTINEIRDPLDSINGTLQKLAKNTDEIDFSVENVGQTLDTANKSMESINTFVSGATKSTHQINETISNIELSVNNLQGNVDNFILDLKNLPGSLPEINQKILNDKETVTIMKEESSILKDSINIINDKVKEIRSTYEKMSKELNTTAATLESSGENISEIKHAVQNVNESLTGISQTLLNINDSLSELNISFHNISSAFPNIDFKIQKVISTAQNLRDASELLLNENLNSRQDTSHLSSMMSVLVENMLKLRDEMTALGNTLGEIDKSKLKATEKINKLLNSVKYLEEEFEENAKKVGLLNESFDEMINRYEKLEEKSLQTTKAFKKPSELLDGLQNRLKKFRHLISRYPRLFVDLDMDTENLTAMQSSLLSSSNLFSESFDIFKSKNNSLWLRNGSPKINNLTKTDLERNIESLNSSMNKQEEAVKQAYLTTESAVALSRSLNNKLDNLNETLKNFEDIHLKSSLVDKSLRPLIEKYRETADFTDGMIYVFGLLLGELDEIEGKYGNINGTFNATDEYRDLRRLFLDSLKTLKPTKDKLDKEMQILSTSHGNYDALLSEFNRKRFGIDVKSDADLDDVLVNLDNILLMIDNLNSSWNTMKKSLTLTSDLGMEGEKLMHKLANELWAKMQKNEYVRKKRKRIGKDKANLSFSLNDTLDNVHRQNKTISMLKKDISVLKEKADKFGTMVLAFTKESDVLNTASTSLEHILGQLLKSKVSLQETIQEYTDFNTENASMDDITLRYQKYLNSLETLEDDVNRSQGELVQMDKELETVNKSLGDISYQLSLYPLSLNYLNQTGSISEKVKEYVLTVQRKLNSSFYKFKDMLSYFQYLETNYANITSGTLNKSDVYIRDLINEKQKKIDLVKDSLLNVTKSHNSSANELRELNNSFLSTVYTRNNIQEELQKTNSSLDRINEKLYLFIDQLDRIDIALANINEFLYNMDDVLHERNEKLFIKRQKQLYISEKLPELLAMYNKVNRSLADAENERIRMVQNLSSLITMKSDIVKLQLGFDNMNISMNEIESKLRDSQRFTADNEASLNSLKDIFKQINKSIVSENAWDILKDMPFESTKFTFEEIFDVLGNLSSNLSQILLNTDRNKSQLNSVNEILDNITALIEGFKLLDRKAVEQKEKATEIEELSHSIDENLKKLDKDADDFLQVLSTLETDYKGLNSSFLHEALALPKHNVQQFFDTLSGLHGERNLTTNMETLMQKLLHQIRGNLMDNISSANTLKMLTDEVHLDQKNLDEVIQNVSNSHDSITSNIEKLESDSTKLKSVLTLAEQHLKTEQKIEYVNRNLPGLKDFQSNVARRARNASDLLDSDVVLYNFVSSLYNSTKSLTERYPKFNISIKEMDKKLQTINEILKNDTDWLANISIENHKLDRNLTEKRYLDNLNNFSIDDLKRNFHQLNRSLSTFKTSLDLINENELELFDELKKIEDQFEDIDQAMTDMNSVIKYSDKVEAKWHSYDKKLATSSNVIENIKTTVENVTDILDKLNETYKHVKAPDVQGQLQSTSQSMYNLKYRLENVFNTVLDLNESNRLIALDIDSLQNLTLSPATNLRQLYRDIDKMESLASTTENSTALGETILNETDFLANGLFEELYKLQNISEKLKLDFQKQEKLEHLENMLPSLEKKYDNIMIGLHDTNTTINNTNGHLSTARERLSTLMKQLSLADKVNVSVKMIENRYNEIEKDIEELFNNLEHAAKLLSTTDIHGISDNTSLTDDTFSFSNLRQFLTDLDKDLNSIWGSVNGTKANAESISDEVEDTNAEVSGLLRDLLSLSKIENEKTEMEYELSKMQSRLNHTDDKLQNLSMYLQHLNNSLQELLQEMNGMNNSELAERIRHLEIKLEKDSTKTDELDSLLMLENNSFNKTEDMLKILDNLLDKVSEDHLSLGRKLLYGWSFLDELKEKKVRHSEGLNIVEKNLPLLASQVGKLKSELQDIRKDVEQQKIKDFIKHNFPEIIENYNAVNSSLFSQTKFLNDLQTDVSKLQRRTVLVEDKIATHFPLNISLDNIWIDSKNMTNTLKNVGDKHKKLENTFKSIGLTFIPDLDNNQTIEDVKRRFLQQLKRLKDLKEMVINLTFPLEYVKQDIQMHNRVLAKNNKTVQFYESMSDQLTSLNSIYDQLNETSNHILRQHSNNSDSIADLLSKIQRLQRRFSNVSDGKLHETRQNIQRNIEREKGSLKPAKKLFDDIYKEYSDQRKEFLSNQILLNTPVESFEILESNLQFIANSTQALEDRRSQTDMNFNKVMATLENQTQVLLGLSNDTSVLEQEYKETEKHDFINTNLPALHTLIDKLRKSLNQSERAISAGQLDALQTKDLVNTLKRLISVYPLQNISTGEIESIVDMIQHSIQKSDADLSKTEKDFENLNSSVLNETFLTTLSLETIRTMFSHFNQSLINMTENLIDIDASLQGTINDSVSAQAFLNETIFTVEKYNSHIEQVPILNQTVKQTNQTLKSIQNTFEDVSQMLQTQISELNILSNQDDFTNDTKNIIIDMLNLTGKMVHRLPILQNHFEESVINPNKENIKLFKAAAGVLNNSFSSFEELQNTTESVTNSFEKVSDTDNNIGEEARLYQNEVDNMFHQLRQKNETLTQIKELLRLQNKENFVDMTFPRFLQRYKEINISLNNAFQTLHSNNASIENVIKHVEKTNAITDNISNINTLTKPYMEDIERFKDELAKLFHNVTSVASGLSSFNLSELKDKEELLNDTVTLDEIENIYKEYDMSFSELESALHSVLDKNAELKPKITELDKHLKNVDKMLLFSSTLEVDLRSVSNKIENIHKNKSETRKRLETAEIMLQNFNNSLFQLKENYEEFVDDTNDEEMIIEIAKTKIYALNTLLGDVNIAFVRIADELKIANETFYKKIDTADMLNSTLDATQESLTGIREKINTLIENLELLGKEIPLVESNVSSVADAVNKLELMLSNQQNKSNILRVSKPLTDKKLASTLAAFRKTNDSLEKAIRNSQNAKDAINKLQQKLNTVPTINIPLTDIDANISSIIENLKLMHGTYDRLNQTYETLKDDIFSFNVLNASLTVNDVESKFSGFNMTLIDIAEQLENLTKMADSLEPHFRAINEEVSNLNNGIDEFSQQDSEISILGGITHNVDESLRQAKENINSLNKTFLRVNDTVTFLEKEYFDVINKMSDNITQVKSAIETVHDFLTGATKRLEGLKDLSNASKSNITQVYDTLHTDIDTYSELKKLLENTSKSNADIRKQMQRIKNGTLEISNGASDLENSILDLPSILDDLRKTLNEEQKKKYMTSAFPQYYDQFIHFNVSLNDTFKKLTVSNERLHEVSEELKIANSKLQEMPTIDISTYKYQEDINGLNQTLNRLYLQAFDAFGKYGKLDSSALTGQAIVENETITLRILRQNYNKSKQLLNETKSILESVEADNEILSAEITKALNDVVNLIQILKNYDDVKDAFNLISQEIPFARYNISSVDKQMTGFKNQIQNLDTSVLMLQNDYDTVGPNNISERQMIQSLHDIAISLESRLHDAASLLQRIENMHKNTNHSLNKVINVSDMLNQTLNSVKLETLTMKNSIRDFTIVLQEILKEMPNLDVNIRKVGDVIDETDKVFKLHQNTETSLSVAERNIKNLFVDASYLNDSFASLKNIYFDVINKSSDNMTLMDSTMRNVFDFLNGAETHLEDLNTRLTHFKSQIVSSYDAPVKENDTYGKLSMIREDVLGRNIDVSERLQKIQEETLSLKNRTDFFEGTLSDIPGLLDTLRTVLDREQKKNYIDESLPQYETQYAHLNVSLNDTFKKLRSSRELLHRLSEKLQSADSTISRIPSFNMSTYQYEKEVSTLEHTLNNLFAKATDALDTFKTLNAEVPNSRDIVENNTITLDILRENYEKSKGILERTRSILQSIEKDNKNLNSVITETTDDLEQLLQILKAFERIGTALTLVSKDINVIKQNKTNVEMNIDSVKKRVDNLDALLLQTDADYSEFRYNSSSEKNMIKALRDMIINLDHRLNDTASLLMQIENSHGITYSTLYALTDSPQILNITLNNVNKEIISLERDIKYISLLLQQILDEIPSLDVNISVADRALDEMENILINQQNKAKFVKDAKPELEERLENTTSAFNKTNLSLERMQRQIHELQNYVDSIRARLDALPTINISLTEIDTNITEMENRLLIMQDYYNNVQEVISHLHRNIESSDIFKTNLSLDNVENRYSIFNQTLDDVNGVLGKIGREFDTFGSQFIKINTSLGNVDDAIGRFEEKSKKIKVLEKDIYTFGYSLNETNRNIDDMVSVMHRLNDSFSSLKQNYSDVINRTEEKNTNIEQKINDINSYLKEAKSIIDNVSRLYSTSQSNVSLINQSLFKDIHTYEDLNATLSDVKKAYLNLRSQLKDMKYIIDEKSNETNAFNSTITGVSNVLEELKVILDAEQKDHEKVLFINSHVDEIRSKFTALQQPFKETKISIAERSDEIEDVQLLAKQTGNRLSRFRTFDITADVETKKAESFKSALVQLNKNFTATDEAINKVRDLIASLEDRNVSLDDIKTKFESVNSTIHTLNATLADIDEKLAITKNETAATNDALLKFQSSMDMFKSIQRELSRIHSLMKTFDASETITDLENTRTALNKIEKTVAAMDLMQSILEDSDYSLAQPKLVSNLTTLSIRHSELDNESSEIVLKLDFAKHMLEKLSLSIRTALTRENIDEVLPDLREQLKNTSKIINDLQAPSQDTNKRSNALRSQVQTLDVSTENIKTMLTAELDKYQFVRDTLPLLQAKHREINKTLEESRPSIENVKSKLEHMKEVMTKITEKMKIFGIEDIDGTVQKLDKQIIEIETSVEQINNRHSEYETSIASLKKDLWKDIKAMYTKADTLKDVKSRFEKLNKTLSDMDDSFDDLIIRLKDLDISANTVGQDLVDRNTILTTTPPTTTPSGAPDWLNFSSSGGGVIGRDSATLECIVEDLTMWGMMKIEKVRENGNRLVLAAWKLGAVARKTVRDRRIRVKKEEDGSRGALIVTINKLSCEDQATYLCTINTYHMWPVQTTIAVSSLPEDSLVSSFPTEVFEDKTAIFACTGYPGYPDGEITWRIRHENETEFRDFEFYSQISNVSDENCRRKEINSVPFQFDMSWNNTYVRCYIANTNYYAQGQIRLLPYDICNKVRYLGTIGHPYTPHKYIVCGKELNIMQCPGNTCYDDNEHNCVQCKADHRKGDPCLGQSLYSYVPHETDCTKYYICMGPTKSTKKCTRGYFSPRVPGYCVLAYSQSECARKQ